MCTGYLQEDDGSDPRLLWRSHWNHRLCHHTWWGWCRTWQETTKVHEGCKRTWTGTEQEEVWSQEQLCQVFWICSWQAWSPPISINGQCHQGDACPTEQRRASELPWNGNSHHSSCNYLLTEQHSENTKKPVTIQVDVSGKGLGATLIQDDGPVAFTSNVLTPIEQCYANNKRELLTCIFGAEHFWTYVFSGNFIIVTTNH